MERGRNLEAAERQLEARILAAVPKAQVRWRYRRVLAGLAVVVPADATGALERLPGVAAVYPSARYHAALDPGPGHIGAPALGGPYLSGSAGRGMKIGIIDEGVDPSHPFFNPDGFVAPEGFPKGQLRFTSGKIIVARAFPAPGSDWRYSALAFDPKLSEHGTHVAGIAAGNAGTIAPAALDRPDLVLSGVAPLAFIGNYKALTYPTASNVGLNGNSPELVAAIEAAVEDGMDVINLSLGEAEVPPERDVVAKALDGAAAAGVIPVAAAGNIFQDFGPGTIDSPGTSARAITVAAADTSDADETADPEPTIASFSSGGPTPLGLAAKPDVSAPGVNILSSVPRRVGLYDLYSGTSMAAPYVAGAAALLRERHPDWTVAQVKSALVTTGRPVMSDEPRRVEASSTRQGGGLIDVAEADVPLLFAEPQAVSFGLLDVGKGPASGSTTIRLDDAGGGAGSWNVEIVSQQRSGGAHVLVPQSIDVPGTLDVTARAGANAVQGERTGFIVLRRGEETRRLPFWFRVTRPLLATGPARILSRPGTFTASTRGAPARVDRYRYPDDPGLVLKGPERVFRFRLRGPVANFGVAVVDQEPRAGVEPRIVVGADENRLLGLVTMPYVVNPYLELFRAYEPVAGALRPTPGLYSIVFDSRNRASAGRFTFRFWVNDVNPPRVTLLSRRGRKLVARVTDAGSGVPRGGVTYSIDGRAPLLAEYDPRSGRAILDLGAARAGRHRLELVAYDYQELKNGENTGPILPNTRVVETTVVVPSRA